MIGDETQANGNTIKNAEEKIRLNSDKIARIEMKQTSYDNMFDFIAGQLETETINLKGVIHRNIAAETPEEKTKQSQLMDHNKVSQRILETLCTAYEIQLLIFDGRNKRKQFYGERKENGKLIGIFHIRNMYTILKRRENQTFREQLGNTIIINKIKKDEEQLRIITLNGNWDCRKVSEVKEEKSNKKKLQRGNLKQTSHLTKLNLNVKEFLDYLYNYK